MVLGGDLGCLFNLAGKLKRENSSIQVRHAAEILAGLTDKLAIGEVLATIINSAKNFELNKGE